MGNVFEFVNADRSGDFGYPFNWVDLTNPFVYGPPGPTDVAIVETAGTINGSANVNTLILAGDGGLLTSTLQIDAAELVLEGNVAISGFSYSNISYQVEEAGTSTVTVNDGSELYINNAAADTFSGIADDGPFPFDVGVSSGDQSTFNLTGLGSAILLEEGDAAVGDVGIGAMTIASGAELETRNYNGLDYDGDVVLGEQPGSQGTLTVTGQSSNVQASGNITVGNFGEGTLSILAGADAVSSGLVVADEGAPSSVLVSGSGSQLVAGLAIIGETGTGSLTIEDAGSVQLSQLQVSNLGGPGNVSVEGVYRPRLMRHL